MARHARTTGLEPVTNKKKSARPSRRWKSAHLAFAAAGLLHDCVVVDQILVLEDGGLVEYGDHETLLAQSGRYRVLYDLQFGLTPTVVKQ